MAKRAYRTSSVLHSFTKGDELQMDDIYTVHGINGDWWEHVDDDPSTDRVIITKTVRIETVVKYYE